MNNKKITILTTVSTIIIWIILSLLISISNNIHYDYNVYYYLIEHPYFIITFAILIIFLLVYLFYNKYKIRFFYSKNLNIYINVVNITFILLSLVDLFLSIYITCIDKAQFYYENFYMVQCSIIYNIIYLLLIVWIFILKKKRIK